MRNPEIPLNNRTFRDPTAFEAIKNLGHRKEKTSESPTTVSQALAQLYRQKKEGLISWNQYRTLKRGIEGKPEKENVTLGQKRWLARHPQEKIYD